jgi:hypothetical protein
VSTAVKAQKWCCRLYFKTFNPEEVLLVIANALHKMKMYNPLQPKNPKRAKQPVEN